MLRCVQPRIQPRLAGTRASSLDDTSESLSSVETGAGMLEMWCIERYGDSERKFQFDVRNNPRSCHLVFLEFRQ